MVEGLQELLSAIQEAAKGGSVDVKRVIAEVGEAAADTLAAEYEGSEEAAKVYVGVLSRAAATLAHILAPRTEPCRRVASLLAHCLAGLALNRQGECVFMKMRGDVRIEGALFPAGSTACIPLDRALGLQAAGLGEVLLIGRLPEA